MIIEPRVRGFICTTAHPVGCAAELERGTAFLRAHPVANGPRRVLVIGASMGYGLATRQAAAFGAGAATLGVFLERPAAGKRTATAGWYNTAAFHRLARKAGLYAESINGDAFSEEVKAAAAAKVLADLGQLDLVVYSLAAPRRPLPDGRIAKSTLKPISAPYRNKTVDVERGEVSEVELSPASPEEVADTVAVMGGDDWQRWIEVLRDAGALAEGVTTLAYSYLGPELTYPIYRQGTIGRAKDHLEATAGLLGENLAPLGGRALISVNKAVVTQSSSAIPVVPLYISILFAVMQEKGLHEGSVEQMYRLLAERLYSGAGPMPVDEAGRVRLDDLEMRDDVQAEVAARWERVTSDNLDELADLEEYRRCFLRLFGFGVEGVDYSADVDPDVPLD